MSEALARELDLPPIDQVAWVVRDLDRALETFGPLFGDFQTMTTELQGTLYRGRRSDVTLRLALGRSGGIEIELIEVVSGESPHRELLEKHGEGAHHVRFRVDDLDPPRERLREMGFEEIWFHAMPGIGARWSYLEAPPERGGALVELLQLPEPG